MGEGEDAHRSAASLPEPPVPGFSRVALLACTALIKVNWGIGEMAMPFYLQCAGVVTGVAFFIFTMALTQFSIMRLLHTRDALRKAPRHSNVHPAEAKLLGYDDTGSIGAGDCTLTTYSSIVAAVLGPVAEAVSLSCIVMACIGSNIAYIVFIKDNMSLFVGGDELSWVVGSTVFMLPFCSLDSVDGLAPASFVGLALGVGFEAVLLYNTSLAFADFSEFWAALTHGPGWLIAQDVSTLPIALGLAVFCNEGIVVLSPSVQDTMSQEPSHRRRFGSTVLPVAITFFTLNYLTVAIAGYALYAAEGVESEISLNFRRTAPGSSRRALDGTAAALYACQLIPSFIMVSFVCFEAVEERVAKALCLSGGRNNAAFRSGGRFRTRVVLARMATFVFCSLVAMTVPRFGDFLALLGSIANSCSIYMLPHLCFLQASKALPRTGLGAGAETAPPVLSATSAQRLVSMVVICFGVVSGIIGSVVSGMALFS